MALTSKTKYAFNIIGYLMLNNEEGRITCDKIASECGLSTPFVSATMRDLRLAGLVDSKKGPGGGYYISADKTNMSVGDITEATGERPEIYEQQELFDNHVCKNIINELFDNIKNFNKRPIVEFL